MDCLKLLLTHKEFATCTLQNGHPHAFYSDNWDEQPKWHSSLTYIPFLTTGMFWIFVGFEWFNIPLLSTSLWSGICVVLGIRSIFCKPCSWQRILNIGKYPMVLLFIRFSRLTSSYLYIQNLCQLSNGFGKPVASLGTKFSSGYW